MKLCAGRDLPEVMLAFSRILRERPQTPGMNHVVMTLLLHTHLLLHTETELAKQRAAG